jgi:next-to-BRCA1 protein 1
VAPYIPYRSSVDCAKRNVHPSHDLNNHHDPMLSTPTNYPMAVPSIHPSPLSRPAVQTTPVAGQNPTPAPPLVHVGVSCDRCRNTIVGVRHKCLDCPGNFIFSQPPLH